MSRLPDFEAWAIFAKVVETGSFTQTANELMLSQATVSKAVSRLEQRLNTTLFHRTSRKMVLTESGAAAVARAKRILHEGEQIEAEMGEQVNQYQGKIRFTAPMSFGLLQVAPLLPDFLAAYPAVRLDMNLSDEAEDLLDNRYDFALRIAKLEDSALLVRKICDVPILLVGAPAYFARHGKPKHPKDLARHKALQYSNAKNSHYWRFSYGGTQEYTQAMDVVMQANNAEAFTPALVAGLGLALQPEFMVRRELQNGSLETALDDWQTAPLGLYLLSAAQRHRPLRVNALMDFLLERLRRR
ncbi:transcriptional regulator, LysR family [Pasteurella testudinis DSM 23072]|uniref:Transcriptional regulator, LysR family n=1 Tax=Pasteurella testudinis DSM 23072 TaxID=1122938 RepID=A0A1W1ULC6_9PAST|nr:LysR family transcriptional regulator [Pasteurella testudinis]SMB81819.1 transcriptional regulator, LysR family [Pasteurella testudinis DSM 23072]SUB50304.1 glycine cleavage system transcriptional activator [Pasteurella testudinis]